MRTIYLAVLFALGIIGMLGANAQSVDHVVINEVDTNPPGDDAKSVVEWVELYNPTDKEVDVGGWKIASTTISKKTMVIPAGTIIKPGQFLIYSYTTLWFTDVSEKVQLIDDKGGIVDQTPVISDQKNDFSSWQRKFDGIDTDTSNDWVFRTSSAGSSNGKLAASTATEKVTIYVNTDKKSYLFGQTAVISGNVSKMVFTEKPSFMQQAILLHVDGPGTFEKKFTLYPDANLQYKTQFKLDQILGVNEGHYLVTAKYGEAEDKVLFSVGKEQQIVSMEEKSELTISTDKTSYIPGQLVTISATTNKVIPLEGLDYAVYDPNGIRIFSGKLYPNSQGQFSGSIFMTTVKPVYGKYSIVANYGKQQTNTSFELVADIKDIKNIILTTDKSVYSPGDTVIISGRSNKYVVALDMEILQTGMVAIDKDTAKNPLKIKDQLTLAGDSTFKYELKIPSDSSSLGDYRVTVSKEFGSAIAYFKVVEDPKSLTTRQDMFVSTDKKEYLAGEKLKISGHVVPKSRSTFQAIPVKVSITDESGKQLSIISLDKKKRLGSQDVTTTYDFTAIPDSSGNFAVETVLNPGTFKIGSYTVKATYEGKTVKTLFSVKGMTTPENTKLSANLNKSIYGLGEKVILEGTILSGQPSVKIILTKPDGKILNFGSNVDAGRFAWSWDIPQKDFEAAEIRDPRQPIPTVFGNYKISVIIPSETLDLFFKVSKTPDTDTFEVTPLSIRTDKAIYSAGEKLTVSGEAVKRKQGSTSTGGIVPERVTVQVKTSNNKEIYSSQLPFDSGGHFTTTYDLPLTVFKDGTYKVTAIYGKVRAETKFEVKNNVPIRDSGKLTLTLNTDKDEYVAGETVHIWGSTNRVIFLNNLDLFVIPEESTKINCGTSHCGEGGQRINIARSYNNGIYSYDYTIPKDAAIGNYIIKVNAEFGTFTKIFKVVEKKMEQKTEIFSEKFNRISQSVVDVALSTKTVQQQTLVPIILQGSLFTPKGSEGQVNLRITAEDGQCVIGQASECLVSESTSAVSAGYKAVTIGTTDYKITYSGSSGMLEKFSITTQSEEDTIPDTTWKIEIENNDGKSRLYYEIVYKIIQ